MYRYVIGAIVVAVAAALIGWKWNRRQQAEHAREQAQIAELSEHVRQLEQENSDLKAALAKVQAEENRLVTENQILTKTLEQARLTGKIPDKLPYPPK
ncbi:MAG TPA: hypothetical protein VFB33_07990 [Candidatus Binataceae bacterium]|jgi:predicted negative regulator of RcsB-dependent stress response|nr:hypothetical protein [Candidatus Binataceae bacterium]